MYTLGLLDADAWIWPVSATNSDSSCRVKIIGILKRIAQSAILAEPCKHFLADNTCFNPKPLVHVLCVQCFLHSAGSGEDRWSLKHKMQLISLEKKGSTVPPHLCTICSIFRASVGEE